MCGLLAVVAAAAVVTWRISEQPRRREKAIDAAKRLGGYVQLDREHVPMLPAPLARPSRDRKSVV